MRWEDKPFRVDELEAEKVGRLSALQISGCCACLLLSRHLHFEIGYGDADSKPKHVLMYSHILSLSIRH